MKKTKQVVLTQSDLINAIWEYSKSEYKGSTAKIYFMFVPVTAGGRGCPPKEELRAIVSSEKLTENQIYTLLTT